MGFHSFRESTPNPAQRYYRWSGGAKDVILPDGSKAKQPRGELLFYNGEEMESIPLPFTFCVLEQTSSITGYAPNQGSAARYFSNEITSADEIMQVSRQTNEGTSIILKGKYKDIKSQLPKGAKYQTNLYIYNPTENRIERINMNGSCLSSWIEFCRKNRGIYEHVVSISAGELKTTANTVDFIAPKFELGAGYSPEEEKVLVAQDNIVIEYLKYRRNANLANAPHSELGQVVPAEVEVAGVDQTPAQYDGEGSQETTEQNPEDAEIRFEDLPF